MANKLKKIKEELLRLYHERTWIQQKREYTSESIKDYDRYNSESSMSKAFERGFGNCEAVYEDAIKKWVKKMDMNASSVLFHIKQEFNDEKIKLK